MTATEKLYDQDAYIREFDASVLSIKNVDNDTLSIVLDRTAFFPEAGGQSSDRGTLGGLEVIHVELHADGVISHICRDVGTVPPVGKTVHGEILWERRHTFMQHHTGEHVFSGLVNRDYGYANVGFHLSDHICTMDYNGVLTDEAVMRLEKECNEWIYRNVPVTCAYPDERALQGMAYRCKGELSPPIRIVAIDGVDTCACCAPHVRSTGEIGLLKVIEAKSYKGGVRLTILCGRKAFHDYLDRFAVLADASHLLSSQAADVPERITALLEDRFALNGKVSALQEERLAEMINAVPDTQANALFFVEDIPAKSIRHAVNSLMEQHDGCCGIFCGNDAKGYQFILGSQTIDMTHLADRLRKELPAKCGGSPRMIQGQTSSEQAQIRTLLSAL